MSEEPIAKTRKEQHIVFRYILQNKLFSLFFLFIGVSVLLKAYTSIDITIPCPIKLVTGRECFGCGITTACTHLAHLEFTEAVNANILIIPLVPAFLLYLIWDVRSFLKQ